MQTLAGPPGPALVLGFADCLDEDYRVAHAMFPQAVLFGVNRAVKRYRCQHLVSLDRARIPDFLPDYPITVHAGRFGGVNQQHGPKPYIDAYWPHLQPGSTSGSSGWLAAKIAVKLGHGPVVLCGCPIDAKPHVEQDKERHDCLWTDNPNQVPECRAVIERETDYHPYVRSMSGWSRDLLGAP